MPQPNDSSKTQPGDDRGPAPLSGLSSRTIPSAKPWLALPAPLKHLFSLFPVHTLPSAPLPSRTAHHRNQHTLYVFTTPSSTAHDPPSFNPTCLKWQTYLNFLGLDFRTVASTNHASPTGALPFLIPASSSRPPSSLDGGESAVVPINKIQKWLRGKGLGMDEPENFRYEAYMALLDHRIRRAWLYALYISPANFRHVATPLYINPSTRSLPVRFTLSRALQAAALAELLTTSSTISADSLIRDADGAFSALSTLLGDEEWFFGAEQPGLFDASVFAYTYLLIDGIEWRDDLLRKTLEEYQNLVEHKDRIGQKSYNIDNCARTHRDKE